MVISTPPIYTVNTIKKHQVEIKEYIMSLIIIQKIKNIVAINKGKFEFKVKKVIKINLLYKNE